MSDVNIERFVEKIVREVVSHTLQNQQLTFKKRDPLVVANWKMNMTFETIAPFMAAFSNEEFEGEVVICPPYPYLYPVKALAAENKASLLLGAQNVHYEQAGAYTGEVSVSQLKDIGCQYVIIGHSERRASGETELEVMKKVNEVHEGGLYPILCVGETESEWQQKQTKDVVQRQVVTALEHVSDFSRVVIAYEPVWAIGTGKSAAPDQAQEVHHFIRNVLTKEFGAEAGNIRLLYGGSVKPENAREFSFMEDIDGSLVGGASLQAETFKEIIQAFARKEDDR